MTVAGVVGYSIGEVATSPGVTVRALHHDDRIGLLRRAGHRRYRGTDLDRLRRIAFSRGLGFALPRYRRHALRRASSDSCDSDSDSTAGILAGVETEIEARPLGTALSPEQ